MSTLSTTKKELPKQYEPARAERTWYRFWEDQGFFHRTPHSGAAPYCIVIPPPNVTGALHLGHALNNTLQDILIRKHRMQGDCVLWVPGTDHAGIATQAVVERRLLQDEQRSRHDLGREKLVALIWKWKDEYERRILDQLKQLGASCDWQRTRFTLDPLCARAVRHTFFRMFRDGFIYRGKRLVNWDTFLQTAVSDDEVFHEPVQGHFWHFRYPVVDPRPGEPTHVTIATTRPETMLGDTAVAVHPDPSAALDRAEAELNARIAAALPRDRGAIESELEDLRRRRKELLPQLIKLRDMALDGRTVRLPLANREIPLITDEWAKPELGSGCVKITPAHDPNDYDVGRRHALAMLNILNPDGTLNANAGAFAGQTIDQARENVVAAMKSLGHLEKIEDREIDLAHSDRSKTPIEPYLADQWFVKMDQLAQWAMDAVTSGRIQVHPSRYVKGYLDWLAEKRDWPVSRQLWWGHQIPIWYAKNASEEDLQQAFAGRDDVVWRRDEETGYWLVCALEDELAKDAIPGQTLEREQDVLDTWFSSALWPHSTLGWPSDTPDLRYFYPTSVLVTSRDIITLWVARMVIMGLYNVGEVPFRKVYIHPKILDGYGETMSKSKGNGVDPLDVIEKFGADSLRFALAYLTTETQDIRMPVDFECPHCRHLVPQTKENRQLPTIDCTKCRKRFSTQWASKPEDKDLPRGAVVSDRFEVARNFCNKLWNASRFALMHLEGYTHLPVAWEELLLEDRWILSRLASVTELVTDAIDQFRFADAARALYDFAWDQFCSFYVEMLKPRLQRPTTRGMAQQVLAHTLDALLRLLHPMMPFLTEEVWQLLRQVAPRRGLSGAGESSQSIAVAPWPEANSAHRDPQIESQFAVFQRVLGALREIRSRQNIPPRTEFGFSVKAEAGIVELLRPMEPYFRSMANACAESWGDQVTPPPQSATFADRDWEVYVNLSGLIDVASEIARNQKELDKLQSAIAAKTAKLSNEGFVNRAPAEVVAAERESLAELQQRAEVIASAVHKLRAL